MNCYTRNANPKTVPRPKTRKLLLLNKRPAILAKLKRRMHERAFLLPGDLAGTMMLLASSLGRPVR
jgi:hypothetical protein